MGEAAGKERRKMVNERGNNPVSKSLAKASLNLVSTDSLRGTEYLSIGKVSEQQAEMKITDGSNELKRHRRVSLKKQK